MVVAILLEKFLAGGEHNQPNIKNEYRQYEIETDKPWRVF